VTGPAAVVPTEQPRTESSPSAARLTGYASFMLVGWAGLLVPSLIRSIEHDFG